MGKLPPQHQRLLHVRKLKAAFQRQIELLVEMAAGYYHRDKQVPPEVGNALGAVECRRRAFEQVGQLYIDGCTATNIRQFAEHWMKVNGESATALDALRRLSP